MTTLFDLLKKYPMAIPPVNVSSPFAPTREPDLEKLVALFEEHADILEIECRDKHAVHEFFFVDTKIPTLEPETRTLQIIPPEVCLDKQTRGFLDYLEYLLATSLTVFFEMVQGWYPTKHLTLENDGVSTLIFTIENRQT
jgi:hypothetical protein